MAHCVEPSRLAAHSDLRGTPRGAVVPTRGRPQWRATLASALGVVALAVCCGLGPASYGGTPPVSDTSRSRATQIPNKIKKRGKEFRRKQEIQYGTRTVKYTLFWLPTKLS